MIPRSIILSPALICYEFLKFQLIKILWIAGANTYRKPENSSYLELFLYEIYLVLSKFIYYPLTSLPKVESYNLALMLEIWYP